MQGESELAKQDGIVCVSCETTNAQTRKFCGNCGITLWSQCPACEADTAVSEKFCGSCGHNLQGLLEERRADFKAKAREAVELAKDKQFDNAIVALRIAIREAGDLLKAEVEKVKPLLDRWKEERDKSNRLAGDVVEQAKEALKQKQYDQCLELIERIHPNVRTDEINSLAEQAKGGARELRRLRSQIENLLTNERAIECLPFLESLLRLRPSDEKARKLAEKIRDAIFKAAKAKFDQGHLESAWKQLAKIRPFVQNAEVAQLKQKVGTALWLLKNVTQATHVDPGLIDSFKRLSALGLKSVNIAKYGKAIKERALKHKGSQPIQYAEWAQAKSSAFLGVPVSWLSWHPSFGGTHLLDKQAGALGSRVSVAVGLALQGLGRAAIPTQLSVEEAANWKSKIRLFQKKNHNAAIGLHVGSSAIKFVRLEQEGPESAVKITEVKVVGFERTLASMTNEFERRDAIRSAILNLKGQNLFDDAPILVSLAAVPILARFCQIPKMEPKRLATTIQNEAKHQIPFDLDDVCWTHHCHPIEATGGDSNFLTLLAAKQAELKVYIELFDSLELKIRSVQSDAIAIHNLIEFLRKHGPANSKGTVSIEGVIATLIYGGDGATLVCSSPKGIWFRYFALGGTRVTRNLAGDLNLTQEQAEKLKLSPVRNENLQSVFQSISKPVGDLANELNRSFDVAQRDISWMKPKHLFVSGGSSELHGLFRVLRLGPESLLLDDLQSVEGVLDLQGNQSDV